MLAGYLFFLDSGIFFGFKKPLHFFPFDAIQFISYTSVLQRTFNLNIAYHMIPNKSLTINWEVEFAMIDQAQFPGIDAYIKKHQLQDSSMAEARRAKKVTVQDTKKESEDGEVETTDGKSELEKAQQALEDEEDEQEEDFEPSDEEGDEDEYAGEDEGHGDLVADELGSEAEEIEPDSDDNQL